MATGITKKQWDPSTSIITDEAFGDDLAYDLNYKGKSDENALLQSLPQQSYPNISGEKHRNSLFYGDNLDVLKHLIHAEHLRGKVQLVYIDPPYGTNSIFYSKSQKSAYKDDLLGSQFIEFIRRRLILLRELMADSGLIYVHLDNNMVFEAKIVMDEVFGSKNFRGFITRKKCSHKNYTKNTYGNISDYILYYSKSNHFTWHRPNTAWSDEKIKKEYPYIDEKSGRRYKKVPIHAPGTRNGETGKAWRGKMPPTGKHWQFTPAKLEELDSKGDIYWSSNGNPRRKVYFDNDKGVPVQDIWLDVQDTINQNVKTTGYPTEKNPLLLERIIQASTKAGDLVLDCFAGSGTTLDVANKLGRHWVGVDNSLGAIEHILKRFFHGLDNMGDYVSGKTSPMPENKQVQLFTSHEATKGNKKASLNFNFYADHRHAEEAKACFKAYNT